MTVTDEQLTAICGRAVHRYLESVNPRRSYNLRCIADNRHLEIGEVLTILGVVMTPHDLTIRTATEVLRAGPMPDFVAMGNKAQNDWYVQTIAALMRSIRSDG